MATQPRQPKNHDVTILYDSGTNKVWCNPELLQPPEHVINDDTVTWTCEKPWAVVFGPDAPFEEEVMGQELKVTYKNKDTGQIETRLGEATAKVRGSRPGDFHKHKYVAVVWTGSELAACDPEVDVEEEGDG
jgi:hypothetical protein